MDLCPLVFGSPKFLGIPMKGGGGGANPQVFSNCNLISMTPQPKEEKNGKLFWYSASHYFDF